MNENIENRPSYIQITFAEFGATEFSVKMDNVNHLQLLMIGSYLEMKAKSLLLQAEAEAAEKLKQNQLVVPTAQLYK